MVGAAIGVGIGVGVVFPLQAEAAATRAPLIASAKERRMSVNVSSHRWGNRRHPEILDLHRRDERRSRIVVRLAYVHRHRPAEHGDVVERTRGAIVPPEVLRRSNDLTV